MIEKRAVEDAQSLYLDLGFQGAVVKKRDGRQADFDPVFIHHAIEKAFRAELLLSDQDILDEGVNALVSDVTRSVVGAVLDRSGKGETLEIEMIQEAVENQLMRAGQFGIARRYILYRVERNKIRALREDAPAAASEHGVLMVENPDGSRVHLDIQRIRRRLIDAVNGYDDRCEWQPIAEEVIRNLYNGVTPEEIEKALFMAVRSRIELEPAYAFVAARLLLKKVYRHAWNSSVPVYEFEATYGAKFGEYIIYAIDNERLDPELAKFDLKKLSDALVPERDKQFAFLGLQTLFDRYLLHVDGRRIETPQYFWMRVSMGLAVGEGEAREDRAIEFYNMLSSFRFVSSTPTLFNSGTLRPQLSSCYLLTVMDDLDHIFKTVHDDASLSKWAGGLGNDWTNVRAIGSRIHGTNGHSQGVIPFLKVANDTAVAVNQGGKRKGALCSYLETWHLDILDFLELRKNTGDDRRRTHDMHTANWIPDLFMRRVRDEQSWTLLSPSEAPDLHDLYGKAFEKRYLEYEAMVERGEIKNAKKIEAIDLWRKMLTLLFETGHPWITFKDPSNIRSPQDHAGVVHSSNLCTEILLNTSEEEAAVCNLGSINLVQHVTEDGLDEEKIAETVRVAMRMLDNVIDINYYPIPETKTSNLRHRPVGLGLMGFQDALYKADISYAGEDGVEFADRSMEMISYYAILASSDLAKERGRYPSYEGSKWDRGMLPIDTLDLLEEERGGNLVVDRSTTMDWSVVRKAIKENGIRNSNCMAIAPTATIANITNVSQSIEPTYKHLYVKSNLSGEFTWVNPYLVADLKKENLWDAEMIDDLKYFDGEIQEIERISDKLKRKYQTAFGMGPEWLIECASRRQKWIDMGQSLNLYIAEPNGKKLSDMYTLAWRKGLKTTYYLRSLAATQVEKSTVDINRRGIQPRWMKNRSASSNIVVDRSQPSSDGGPKQCSIDDPDCESCQ